MKSLLLPFVLAQLAVFSCAQAQFFRIRNPTTNENLELAYLGNPPPWRIVSKPFGPGPAQVWKFQPQAGGILIQSAANGAGLTFQSIGEGALVYALPPGARWTVWRIFQKDEGVEIHSAEGPECIAWSRDKGLTLTRNLGGCQKWVFANP
ncbi:hypothetical protein B0O80DRAFT_482383 [Mortierella sp. GBAus27b]|nr:hypothetical protein B0O80DRAFT_482383 [Mortierella sp. GBAus27b]